MIEIFINPYHSKMTTMKNKTLTLMIFSVFTLALLVGLASAVIVLNPTTFSTSVDQGSSDSFTFTIENTDGSSNYSNFTSLSFVSDLTSGTDTLDSSNIVLGTLPSSVDFGTTSSNITVTINVPSAQAVGTYTGTFTIDADGSVSNPVAQTISLSVTVTAISTDPPEILSCNTIGNPGILDIKDIDFDNKGVSSAHSSFGSDDEWFPLEEIEVEIEIENDGDFDIDDIEVEWGLWDVQNSEWVIDLDDEKDFNLKDGKDEQLFITFFIDDDMDVDLDELDDGDHYRFYVTATGVIDDNNAGVLDGESTCVSDFESTSIIIENDFVVLDNIEFPEVLSCGETVTVTMDVWNVGDNDQDEVSVFVFNKDLDLREDIDVGDIDEFDSNRVEFTFKIPNGLEEKTYLVLFEVFDEDNDIYENDLDDDESEFSIPFRIGDCSASSGSQVLVTANLASEAKAGQSLTIRTTITNTMFDSGSFSVSAAGFGAWADSVQIDQPTVLLNAGESKDVLLTFDVASDAKGSQTFFVEIVSGDGEVTRQPVQVDIQPKSLFGFTGASILGGGNAYLWGIGLLNIILVVVIIIVAVRIARR